jgi:hypothetical protein
MAAPSALGRSRGRLRALRRAGLAGTLLALAAGCAKPTSPAELVPGSLTVRIGPITAPEVEAAVHSAPAGLPMRTEHLVDMLWEAGCVGAEVEALRPGVVGNPDVICALPGRTQHKILVLAHLDGDEREHAVPWHWSGVALLPILYRSIAAVPREHTFEWIAFGRSPNPTARDILMRLGSPVGDDVRAIVDLQEIDPPSLWFASSDTYLRRDFVAASQALGRPLASLRSFAPLRDEARSVVPLIVIATTPPAAARRGARRTPAVEAPPLSPSTDLQASTRLVATFLAYLDETLRLRSEPPPSPSAETGAPSAPAAP